MGGRLFLLFSCKKNFLLQESSENELIKKKIFEYILFHTSNDYIKSKGLCKKTIFKAFLYVTECQTRELFISTHDELIRSVNVFKSVFTIQKRLSKLTV